jgi:hypothetical protein
MDFVVETALAALIAVNQRELRLGQEASQEEEQQGRGKEAHIPNGHLLLGKADGLITQLVEVHTIGVGARYVLKKIGAVLGRAKRRPV